MSKILGEELSEEAIKQLNARESTVIVATISENGYPNTTPVHLITAVNKKTLLLAMNRNHQGVINIRRNPKIMINLCEKGDLNISIRCNAEVFKEEMNCNPAMCVVKSTIIDIKDDSTHSETISGIRYRCRTERGKKFISDVFDELDSYKC
ncbi:MAG: pyridoxamine 5'-phosphate oxidase family protein [Candidatus Thermoplasmatota archaeon]|nr:pyridoxamine 5'-phosphate oxidase family protein [Candidatus Thermoplasmatota archaeon]